MNQVFTNDALQSSKKTDAPTADDVAAKKVAAAGAAPVIIEEKKADPSTVTKRK